MFTPSASPPGNQERHSCASASHTCTAVTRRVSAATASPTGSASSVQRTKRAPDTSRRSSSGCGSGSGSASSCTSVSTALMPLPAARPANSPSADSASPRSVTVSEHTAAGETTAE